MLLVLIFHGLLDQLEDLFQFVRSSLIVQIRLKGVALRGHRLLPWHVVLQRHSVTESWMVGDE